MLREPQLEALLKELLVELRASGLGHGGLPSVLSKRRAARELDISLSKLKALIRDGALMVCEVGSATMVPASEVRRIADSARRVAVAPGRPVRKVKRSGATEEARAVRAALKKR